MTDESVLDVLLEAIPEIVAEVGRIAIWEIDSQPLELVSICSDRAGLGQDAHAIAGVLLGVDEAKAPLHFDGKGVEGEEASILTLLRSGSLLLKRLKPLIGSAG